MTYRTLRVAAEIYDRGVYVNPTLPPATPEGEALGAESEKLENYATELKKYARGEVKEEPVAPECFDANFAVKASSGEDLFLGM